MSYYHYHLNPPVFDFVMLGDAVEPPLLLNCPLCANTSLSCCIFKSLQTFEYFNLNRFSYTPLSFVCSSIPVFIFFCNAVISASCLCRRVFKAVSIFILRAFNHAYFYYFYIAVHLSFTF